jgi:hypothetical protein
MRDSPCPVPRAPCPVPRAPCPDPARRHSRRAFVPADAVHRLALRATGPHPRAPIRQDDLIDSVADALQYISYYHPTDYIRNLARAYEMEQSPAAATRWRRS